jgi:hypothetical protein
MTFKTNILLYIDVHLLVRYIESEFKFTLINRLCYTYPYKNKNITFFCFMFLFSVNYVTQATWLDLSWSSLSSYGNLQ